MNEADAPEFDWAALIARVVHPTRVAIIEALSNLGQPLSPTELTKLFDDPEGHYLSLISYHARNLAREGMLTVASTRQVRGAQERFYVINDAMLTRD